MNTNVWFAPGAYLGFLAAVGGLACGTLVLALLWLLRKPEWARRLSLLMATGAGAYALLLLAFSLFTPEKTLALHEEKHFCEIDCHSAYSVESVAASRKLGSGPQQRTAQGLFYVVTLRARFDETTISSHRGNGPLRPNSRYAYVIDDAGNRCWPSLEGLAALESAQGHRAPELLQMFRYPGDSYATTLVFDLPATVRNPRLLLANGDLETMLMIGHENSLLHKKTYFRLEPASSDKS